MEPTPENLPGGAGMGAGDGVSVPAPPAKTRPPVNASENLNEHGQFSWRKLATLAAAGDILESEMKSTDYGPEALFRQARILEEMFYNTMESQREAPELKYEGAYVTAHNHEMRLKRFLMALQIQRQCMETIRAMNSVNYMQALTQARQAQITKALSPHPPQTADQTIKET